MLLRAGRTFHGTPPLRAARAPDDLDALAASRRDDPERAERRAWSLLADHDPAIAARAAGLLARIHRDAGDLGKARDLFARAIRLDVAAGRLSDLYVDSFALAYTLGVQLRRFDEARAVLAGLARRPVARERGAQIPRLVRDQPRVVGRAGFVLW